MGGGRIIRAASYSSSVSTALLTVGGIRERLVLLLRPVAVGVVDVSLRPADLARGGVSAAFATRIVAVDPVVPPLSDTGRGRRKGGGYCALLPFMMETIVEFVVTGCGRSMGLVRVGCEPSCS